MSIPHAKVIVNPAAGTPSTSRKWPRISKRLKEMGLSFDYEFTEGAGHAIELARAAASGGYRYLIAVGGDGTVHEVANGILRSTGSDSTTLGVVCTGTANSFVRSAGIPRNYINACSRLTSPRRLLIDVGAVEYKSKGQSVQRFFINMAGVGFDAAVVAAAQRLPKYFGGITPYLVELPAFLLGYRNKSATLSLKDRTETTRIFGVVVANGCCYANGMLIAPQAELSDGLLDAVIFGDIDKFDVLKMLPMLYKGSHLKHPKIRLEKVTDITIESSERLLLHADGELIGETPASFRLVPSALSIVV